HIEGGHGERQARLKIGQAPMHGLFEMALRHEVARLIVWHAVSTRPVVPSTVSYEDVREGNAPYRALGHGTHSFSTGTGTVRGRCICQHQAETGLDGWYGDTCELAIHVVMSNEPKMLPGLGQKGTGAGTGSR